MNQIKSPVLKELSSTGKIKLWWAEVTEFENYSAITVYHGLEGGKITETTKKVMEGKNLGKANETNHWTQAQLDFESLVSKKKKEGYNEELGKVLFQEPMLAFDYFKKEKYVKFPCIMQPKYDGVRCIIGNEMLTRKGNTISSFPHILTEAQILLDHLREHFGLHDAKLDGELYSYTLTFDQISGHVRRNEVCKEDVQYIIYDIVCDLPQRERIRLISDIYIVSRGQNHKHLMFSGGIQAHKVEDIGRYHNSCVEAGYEGIMIRNSDGKYKSGRSTDLLKYKKFQEEEFVIVGHEYGEGTEEGCVIWTCSCAGGNFNVRPEGSFENRKIVDPEAFYGKKLTVKFFEYTPQGIPRFPVGKAIRDYE